MTLLDAVKSIGAMPPPDAPQASKKRYSERLSAALAVEVADGLRSVHMRFPYGVVGALFAMPEAANLDRTASRRVSTFQRAAVLLGTISGRQDYTSPGERFEDVAMLLFRPVQDGGGEPWVKLYTATPRQELHELSEGEFFTHLRDIYNVRNPHAQVGVEGLADEGG